MERLFGDKCVNYCVLKETIAKHANTTRDLNDFVGKNVDNGAKCCLDSFSGRRRRGYLKVPGLGRTHGGESEKNTHCQDRQGQENRGSGRPGLRMAVKFDEIDAKNMHKSYSNQQVYMSITLC